MNLSRNTIQRLKRQYGDWVLITGATSGIGAELARKFGEAGFRLVLTGRREERLVALSTELFDQFGTEAIPLPGDLSRREDVEQLLQATVHLPIGIAVLNAGYGTSGKFIQADLDTELNMLDLNARTVLMMTHQLGLRMQAEKRRGAIVLMSSIVAFQGVPNAAHYAATKAYVQSLGEALAREWAPLGIDVLTASPGPVDSGFSERANMRMGQALQPEEVGVPIIRAIGRKNQVLPGWLTKLLVYNLRLAPRWAKVRIMEKVMAGFTRHQ